VGRGRCAARAGCGAVERTQGAKARPGGVVSGAESSARRKEKELTGGPRASAGDVERRAGELGLGHRWAERGESGRRERRPGEREKKERGREWACAGKGPAQGERGGRLGCLG
jgi:hypothetical protein